MGIPGPGSPGYGQRVSSNAEYRAPTAPVAPPVDLNDPEARAKYLSAAQGTTMGTDAAGNWNSGSELQAILSQHASDPTGMGSVLAYNDLNQRRTGGYNPWTDANMYQLGGDPNYATNTAAQLNANAAAADQRTGVEVNQAGMAPWASGLAGAYGGAMGSADALGGQAQQINGVAGQLASSATGAGYTGQLGTAGSLQALAQMPAGPSAAEMAMQAQAGAAQRQQASMAAGARGGNSALALASAANNAATLGGQSVQQIGQQRAAEDLANRQFSAQTLGQASNAFGAAAGTQQAGLTGAANAYGAGGGVLSNQAGAYQGAGGLAQGGLGAASTVAQQNSANEVNQRALNQQSALTQQGAARDVIAQQTANNVAYDTNRTGAYMGIRGQNLGAADTTGRGTLTGSKGADAVLGGVIQAASTVGGGIVAGPAGAAGGAAVGGVANKAISSDIRSKKDVTDATPDITSAFRTIGHGSPRDQQAAYESGKLRWPGGVPPAGAAPAPAPSVNPYASPSYGYQNPFGQSQAPQYSMGQPAPDATAPAAGPSPGRLAAQGLFSGLGALGGALSDVRNKKDIRPADSEIADAFRVAGSQADQIRSTNAEYPLPTYQIGQPAAPVAPTPMFFGEDNGGTFRTPDEQLAYSRSLGGRTEASARRVAPTPVFYDEHADVMRDPLEQMRYTASLSAPAPPTGYAYRYKNPGSPGAAPGVRYGPMAQDLEQTPAGASVVGEKGGRKFIDTDRLALLNASETASQRHELDDLNAKIAAMRGGPAATAPVAYRLGY